MSCLSIDAWRDVFATYANDRTDMGRMAATLATVTSIVADPCYTPERKIELIEKLFDRMALAALEANDGTG